MVDTQIDAIALALSETLNLNTSLAEQMEPWLHRLLQLVPSGPACCGRRQCHART
ncbi:hypothetical protein ACIRSU_12970 [Streptomyces sp. NPDC101160]|uniref:hypothetical protein n=1 Tax=Streptomyces sp. NPDC101160 TaxID=3366118 RepID=UPI0038112C03